jgi:4-alpha-glucanotransferase
VTVDPDLVRLAQAYGVATGYWDQSGVHREATEQAVRAVLRSLGADPDSAEGIQRSLDVHLARTWRRTLPPVFVTIAGQSREMWVHVPHGTHVRGWLEFETGGGRDLAQVDRWVEPRVVDTELIGEATLAIPSDLPLGWHTAHVETVRGLFSTPVVVTPHRVSATRLGDRRAAGVMAQLYSVRSRRSWGTGDLSDLADLATWSAVHAAADFVLINPLHAAEPVAPLSNSPYLPTSRRFVNPLYVRVEAVPEYAYLSAADRAAVEALAASVRASADDVRLDRDAAWTAKVAALEVVRRVALTPGRQAAYDAYRAREGEGLRLFATWCALAEVYGATTGAWPEELRDPHSPAVAVACDALAHRIDLHCWLQWLLDEQLAAAQQQAESAGMRIGIVHDLAVGVHPEGADAWALRDALAADVSMGAPPDMYNQLGQNWSQPPWQPLALSDAAFRPYRDLLRSVLRRAGGVRVDHVLGLFRQWWIPAGHAAHDGAFVSFDHEAMIGILALEAERAGCVVIGEDLGTVEPYVQDSLADRGLLGTTILWFERDDSGALRRPGRWRGDALASVTVHDLPPTAGYLDGEHVRIRSELGLLSRPVEEERAQSEAAIDEWDALMRDYGLIGPDASIHERVVGLHRLLAMSPARMLGIALTDIVGDRRAQNQPGTHREYPNWCMPLAGADGRAVLLEDLDPAAATALMPPSRLQA